MILMFMLLFVGGTPAMQGVVEEKMQRIAEMVLGSVRPFELMMGKLLGLMGVSLTLAALYLAGAYALARHYGMADLISPAVLAWFIAYLVVGVVMYGALFIAVGCGVQRHSRHANDAVARHAAGDAAAVRVDQRGARTDAARFRPWPR